jgi:hypothetical protein
VWSESLYREWQKAGFFHGKRLPSFLQGIGHVRLKSNSQVPGT